MVVNATEFKNNVGKFLELISKEEIVISRNGKQIAKLIPIDKQYTPNLNGLLELINKNDKPNIQLDLNKIHEERLNKYEGLT